MPLVLFFSVEFFLLFEVFFSFLSGFSLKTNLLLLPQLSSFFLASYSLLFFELGRFLLKSEPLLLGSLSLGSKPFLLSLFGSLSFQSESFLFLHLSLKSLPLLLKFQLSRLPSFLFFHPLSLKLSLSLSEGFLLLPPGQLPHFHLLLQSLELLGLEVLLLHLNVLQLFD